MKNKTCGECKYFPGMGYYCPTIGRFCDPNNEKPCEFFEKPMGRIATTGDKIRQMNNTDLAEMLVYPVKPMNINGNIHYEFTSCLLLGKSYPMREQAVFLTERRLNAPAESEGKDE